MTKMMKGSRCAKSTPHTLYSLSSFMSKKNYGNYKKWWKKICYTIMSWMSANYCVAKLWSVFRLLLPSFLREDVQSLKKGAKKSFFFWQSIDFGWSHKVLPIFLHGTHPLVAHILAVPECLCITQLAYWL